MSTRLKAFVVLGAAAMLITACSSSGGGTAAPSAARPRRRPRVRGAVRGAVRERREREDQGHSSHQGHGRFLGCHDRGRQAV